MTSQVFSPASSPRNVVKTAFIVGAVIVLGLLVWQLTEVWVLIFAAILFAVILRSIAAQIECYTPISAPWSLMLAILSMVLLGAAFVLLLGFQVKEQFVALLEQLPEHIGLPSVLALGFMAGIAEFIPILGPLLAAAPAILIAFSEDRETRFWVIGLFIVVQQLEGYVISPLVQPKAVHLPPVLTILSIVGFGILLGLPGVVMAGPLAVTLMVAVQRLYVRETRHCRVSAVAHIACRHSQRYLQG